MAKFVLEKKLSVESETSFLEHKTIESSDYIEEIFNGNSYAEYVGGTLTFKINDELQLISLSSENRTEKELYWAALCYLKYKGSGHSLSRAYNILSNYKDAKTAKLLLTIIPS